MKNAANYAGIYTSPEGKKLELSAEGDKLIPTHHGRRVGIKRAGGERFTVHHPDFELFLLGFARENQQVTQAFHGSDWYIGERYKGPKTFDTKKDWEGFVGHYCNDSAWYGNTRVVLRKGQLFVDGVQPLIPRGDGKFGIGDPEAPDWISFDSIVDGRAMRMS